mgnify:FL=1
MTPLDYAKYSSIGSVVSGIGGAFAESQSYKIKKYQAQTRAKISKMQGEADSLMLQRQFNKTMASNTVMAAAQGRSGGSVEGIATAAQQQLNWDQDFTKLSAEIEEKGYQAQATQYGKAAGASLIGGSLGAVTGGYMDYQKSLYKIGDKD